MLQRYFQLRMKNCWRDLKRFCDNDGWECDKHTPWQNTKGLFPYDSPEQLKQLHSKPEMPRPIIISNPFSSSTRRQENLCSISRRNNSSLSGHSNMQSWPICDERTITFLYEITRFLWFYQVIHSEIYRARTVPFATQFEYFLSWFSYSSLTGLPSSPINPSNGNNAVDFSRLKTPLRGIFKAQWC